MAIGPPQKKVDCLQHTYQGKVDAVGLPIVIPNSNESVLLGAAILGACASKRFHSIQVSISHLFPST